jgi:hypothetical protein
MAAFLLEVAKLLRALLLLAGLLLAGLWWLAHRNSAPLAATTGDPAAATACRVLQVPADLADAVQTGQSSPPFRAGHAQITPLAGFSVAARVLSREDYHFGPQSDYSPTDLALGWGPMSAHGLAERLSVTQGGRWYRYGWGREGPPLPPSVIASHSANMHIVPANAEVARVLADIRANDAIRMDGWLVRIDADEGWHWSSSLSREDAGDGSCELVFVCSLQVAPAAR